MNLRQTIFILIAAIAPILSTFAQENFQKGYIIISAKHDTIHGWIDYRNWSVNPEVIAFKRDENAMVEKLGVEDISVFFVNGESYVKANVSYDVSAVQNVDLTYSPVPQQAKGSAFLLALVKGEKELYLLKDRENRRNLYVFSDGKYDLLVRYRYWMTNSKGTYMVVVERYRDQIKSYLGDCPALESKIKRLAYTEDAISGLFNTFYEQCLGKAAVLFKPREKLRFVLGAVTGLNVSQLKFVGNDAPSRDTYEISVNPVAGVALNILVPRTRETLSILNELIFQTYTAKNIGTNPIAINLDNKVFRTIGMSYVKLNTMFQIQFPVAKARLYLNGGISNGLGVSERNEERFEETFGGVTKVVSSGKLLRDTRKYEQGLLLGLGGKVGNWGIEVRSEWGNGMSVYKELNSSVRRYGLLVSYWL